MRKRKKNLPFTPTSKPTRGESFLSILARLWGGTNFSELLRYNLRFHKMLGSVPAAYYMTYLLGLQHRFDGKKNVYAAPYMGLGYKGHKEAVATWQRLGVLKIVKISKPLNHHFKLDLEKISELTNDGGYKEVHARVIKNIAYLEKFAEKEMRRLKKKNNGKR